MSDGKKMRRVDTFVSTSKREISISHCYSKEKRPKGLEECIMETFKMPTKLGLNARRQLVSDNVVVMEQEGYEAKKEVKRLKIELSKFRKTIKEFQAISNTPMELKRQASFHEGWEKMKDILKREMMEIIEELEENERVPLRVFTRA